MSPGGNGSSAGGARIAIEVRDVHKSYSIPRERHMTLKERALRPGTWLRRDEARLDALHGVSFDVTRGEFFGVIGRNGSGKTTLLKLLASIYKIDSGSIRVAGRLAPFIELGVGFNPELHARDNIVINGVMMGLTPAQARARTDRVLEYAELRDFTELKLKNYSLGMQVRLAFSMMIEVDADVLLVDEVLAVGDIAFQEKCIASLQEKKRQGVTIVLVTHDMGAVDSHCDRAMLIERGVAEAIGEPATVADHYVRDLLPHAESSADSGSGPAGVTAAWLADSSGQTVQTAAPGEPITINATVGARESVRDLRLVVELLSHPEGVRIASFAIGDEGEIPPLTPGQEVTARIQLNGDSLQPGDYRFGCELSDARAERVIDRSAEPLRLRILGEDRGAGAVRLAHRVEVDAAEGRESR